MDIVAIAEKYRNEILTSPLKYSIESKIVIMKNRLARFCGAVIIKPEKGITKTAKDKVKAKFFLSQWEKTKNVVSGRKSEVKTGTNSRSRVSMFKNVNLAKNIINEYCPR